MAAETQQQQSENAEEKPKNSKKTVLENFSRITCGKQKLRINASVNIIQELCKENQEDELKYAVSRLVRGLAGSSLTSKTGFLTTLTVLLKHAQYDLSSLIEMVQKELHTSGSYSKSENADVFTGQVLLSCAVLRAGKLNELSTENSALLMQTMMDASKKRMYLSLLGTCILVDAINKKDQSTLKVLKPILQAELAKPLAKYTLDNFYLLLNAIDKYPKTFGQKFMQNNFGYEKLFCKPLLKDICNVLLDIMPLQKIQEHPVFASAARLIGQENASFVQKYLQEIDNSFANPSPVRHQVLCILHVNLLDTLKDPQVIPDVIGKHFLQETLKHFKNNRGKQQDAIQKSVYKLFGGLVVRCKEENVEGIVRLQLIDKLTIDPGIFILEKITRCKVVQQVVATLSFPGVQNLMETYREILLGRNTRKEWLRSDRVYAAQLMVKLLEHPSARNEVGFRSRVLLQLMQDALFVTEIEREIGQQIKGAFFGALDCKLSSLSHLKDVLKKLMDQLHEDVFDKEKELRKPLELDSSRQLLQRVHAVVGKQKKRWVFQVLLSHMYIQMFNDEHLACDAIEELLQCLQQVQSKEKDDLHWIEVCIDLFLNLLSHDSRLLRSVINCVFSHLCKEMTVDAVHQLITVFDPTNNVLDDDDDDDSAAESDSESNAEDCDDSEMSDDSAIECESNEMELKQSQELKQALQAALMKDEDWENGSVDLDEMSESEGRKLDETLSQVIAQRLPLGRGAKRNNKQPRKEEALMHFRIRVLDLLDTYITSGISMETALQIMVPLLKCFEFSILDLHNKPLQDRLKSSLKKLTALKEFEDTANVAVENLAQLLNSLLDKGSKTALLMQEMSDQISICCMFVVKCSQQLSGDSSRPVVEILKQQLEAFFKLRDCNTPVYLFKLLMESMWSEAVHLVPILMQMVWDEEVRSFRKGQALDLLRAFHGNQRLLAANKDPLADVLQKPYKQFFKQTVQLFEERNYEVREKFVTSLLVLLATMKNCLLCQQNAVWTKLAYCLPNFRAGLSLGTDCRAAFNKMLILLLGSSKVEMQKEEPLVKLKGASHEEPSNAIKGCKKQQKQLKEVKQKKLSKHLRQMCSSNGFDDFNINALEMLNIAEEDSKKRKGHNEAIKTKKRKTTKS